MRIVCEDGSHFDFSQSLLKDESVNLYYKWKIKKE